MKLSEIKDEYLTMEITNFVDEMHGWLNGEDIDKEIVMFMKMRLELLINQMDNQP